MWSFNTYFLFSLLPFALCAPLDASTSLQTRDEKFVWGSLGDSWASGVTFNSPSTDYDGNKNNCLRWKDSYGPLVEANTTWTTIPQNFVFAACSGATLVNLFQDSQGDNPPQMGQVGDPNNQPRMVTYHGGGNNVGFGAVVWECVYPMPAVKDANGNPQLPTYAPEYPNAGPCTDGINAANGRIHGDGPGTLYFDEMATVRDILTKSQIAPGGKANPDFKLYILGYAHFFNTNDNYCKGVSFAPLGLGGAAPGNPPKLSVALRTAFNTAITDVNTILAQVATDINKELGGNWAKFIDISPAFNGHRFCEDVHNTFDQWRNEDVWLWNANPPVLDPPSGDINAMHQWIDQGTMADGTVWSLPDGFAVTGGSEGGIGQIGWQYRPFHPKIGGTTSVAENIVANALADKIPGVVGAAAATVTTSSAPTPTCAAPSQTTSPYAAGGQCATCNEDGCGSCAPGCCANGTC